MDSQTISYYERNARTVATRYLAVQGGISDFFKEAFPIPGSAILDVGVGSGRDMRRLMDMGFNAYGFEPAKGMRDEAIRHFPDMEGKILPLSIPLPDGESPSVLYDGLVCSAVLMHVPERELFDAVFSLKRVLKEGGRLLISIPCLREGLDGSSRDVDGRLFNDLSPGFLRMLFERLGFAVLREWCNRDGCGRDIDWTTLLFELRGSTQIRPLDRIETVLSQDRKTATYKLALFRALSEIGVKEYRQAVWLGSNEVGVPLDLIAEKWTAYYWPICGSTTFIPQNNGETVSCSKPIAFREQLTKLAGEYALLGGWPQFLMDLRGGRLSGSADRMYRDLIKCLRTTIRMGPVKCTSGNVFRYDQKTATVVMHESLWREFCELGHWIEPSIILRWAEETERMSARLVKASLVVDLLLADDPEGREVGYAKGVYDRLSGKRCVWSDKPIAGKFDVDHVIPFSLWHSNDLWNLLPCEPKVNNGKKDSLPTYSLLVRRKDMIMFYWRTVRTAGEGRFDNELQRFLGRKPSAGGWENESFSRLVEAVEITASQRGARRWEP